MRVRGIREPIVYVGNPLPDVDEKVLLDKAGLDLITPSTRSPFRWVWKYGSTLETEYLMLGPQEFWPLRQSEVPEFMREFQELGAIMVDNPNDEEAVRAARLDGLRRAQRFYSDRGQKRINEFRKRHGVAREEMEDYKNDLWAYYLNQAIADFIQDEIDTLRKEEKKPFTKKG